MKKSVLKMLTIFSVVIFCSVFASNAFFVTSAMAAEDYKVEIAQLKTKAMSGKMTQAEYDRLGVLGYDMSQFNVTITDAKKEDSNVQEKKDTSDKAGAVNGVGNYTAPVGGAACKNTKTIFETLACKITTTLDDLRVVVYVIAGFGLVAFAYSAIFGKANWKHLSYIGLGLFLVSMMAPFITYFTHPSDKGYKIKYGDYLPAGDFSADFALVEGKATTPGGGVTQEDCKKQGAATEGNYCLEQVTNTSTDSGSGEAASGGGAAAEDGAKAEPKKAWSLKDLKGSVTSAIKTAQAVHSSVQATKSTLKEVKAQVNLVSNTIKHSGGGVDGLLNIAGTVANAGTMLGQTGYTLGKNLQYNAVAAADGYQDLTLTNEEREKNAQDRAAGLQTNNIASAVSDKKSGIVKKGDNFYDAKGNKVTVALNDQGLYVNEKTGEVLGDKVDDKGNVVVASKYTNLVDNSEKAREYAMKGGAGLTSASNDSQNVNNMVGGIGGGFLGNLAGLATLGASATGNLVDVGVQVKKNETAAAASTVSSQTKAPAPAKVSAVKVSSSAAASGVLTSVSDKSGNVTTKYRDGTMEIRNRDGSSTISYSNGTIVTESVDGQVTTKNKDGSSKTISANGSVTTMNADGTGVTINKDGSKKTYDKDGGYVETDSKGNVTKNSNSKEEVKSQASDASKTPAKTAEKTETVAKANTNANANQKVVEQKATATEANKNTIPAGYASKSAMTSYTVTKSGDNVIEYTDGIKEIRKADGSAVINYPDGSIKSSTAEGDYYEKKADGSEMLVKKDGTVTYYNKADGKWYPEKK